MKALKYTLILLVVFSGILLSCEDEYEGNYNSTIVKITGTNIDFGLLEINEQPQIKSYTIAVQDLNGGLIISATGPFSISTSEVSDFSEKLIMNPEEFGENPMTIYVRFIPDEVGAVKGKITHSSEKRDHINSVSLLATTKLPDPKIEIDSNNLNFIDVEPGENKIQSYTIIASDLTSPIKITASSPYSVSTNKEGDFNEELNIEADQFANGSITVYVKFSPEEQGDFEFAILHSSEDFSSIPEVSLTGTTYRISLLEIEDYFDYKVGDLPAQDRTNNGVTNATLEGWIKVRSANTNYPVVAENLIFGNYSESSEKSNALKLDYDEPASNSNVYAYNLPNQQNPGQVGSYYASFLIRIDALPEAGYNRPVMFVDWLDNGATKFLGALTVEYNEGNPIFGVRYQDTFTPTEFTPVIGETYLVVLKNTVADSDLTNSNNTASVYIFDYQDIPTEEPVADASVTVTEADGNDGFAAKALTLVRTNDPSGIYIIDGIKVAQQWSELFK